VNARSALFDVYGDHLLDRGGAAPVASLVQLMAALDIAGPAVRTAVSRMVTQGWLTPVRLPAGPGYQVTDRAERRLRDAASRIYRSSTTSWDGRWHLVVVEHVRQRSRRDRVRTGLTYLGYAPLRDDTWMSPHHSAEIDGLLEADGVHARQFEAEYNADDAALAASTWDIDGLAAAYTAWLDETRPVVARSAAGLSDREAYVTRTLLVHEWRKFLFRDPGLPRQVLPQPWPGDTAAAFFDDEASRLLPAAARYVDACLRLS
jgi:phenylacetic acid degradation operon negative regulatory protein